MFLYIHFCIYVLYIHFCIYIFVYTFRVSGSGFRVSGLSRSGSLTRGPCLKSGSGPVRPSRSHAIAECPAPCPPRPVIYGFRVFIFFSDSPVDAGSIVRGGCLSVVYSTRKKHALRQRKM